MMRLKFKRKKKAKRHKMEALRVLCYCWLSLTFMSMANDDFPIFSHHYNNYMLSKIIELPMLIVICESCMNR